MSASYIAVRFEMQGHDPEIWMALLGEWPFESFHEEADVVTGYLPVNDWTESMRSFVEDQKGVLYVSYTAAPVKDQNWNEVWESSFQPVPIEQYCYIRATFHEPAPPGFKHEMIIAPKMAFGTGHHATTYMMIREMGNIDLKYKRVFDFGCGTGILSVMAAKEGAEEVIGCDIQPEAIENSIEHAKLNHVEEACTFIHGGFEAAGILPYDVILANINTKIIIEYFDELKSILCPQGIIMLSGIMSADMPMITAGLNLEGLQQVSDQRRDEWVQLTFKGEG